MDTHQGGAFFKLGRKLFHLSYLCDYDRQSCFKTREPFKSQELPVTDQRPDCENPDEG
jgi:hypothetical protein